MYFLEIIFKNDTTMRFSFRTDDMLIWFRFTNIFSTESLAIVDAWKLKDGDYAILTNRWNDIPSWFELHYTEVRHMFSYKLMEKIDSGYEPGEKITGPNIWRINAGDTIAWLGTKRPDIKGEDGVLSIVKFKSNSLLIGESTSLNSIDGLLDYGGFREYTDEEVKKVRNILERIKQEGIPRNYSTEWSLG